MVFLECAHPTSTSLYKCFCFLFPMLREVNSWVHTRTPDHKLYVHRLLQPHVPEGCYHIFHPHTTDLRLAKCELQSPDFCRLGTVSQQPQTQTWCSPLCSANIKSSQDWSPSQNHFLIIHIHMKVCLFCWTYTYKLYQPISFFSICVALTGICQ